MKTDILIAHPHKHHVYHLAAGCQRSGFTTRLVVPFYRKGLGAIVSAVPGPLGRRASGYHHEALESKCIISPLAWQTRRLFTRPDQMGAFERQFDAHVANRIRTGEFCPRVLVTLQDYMPATVRAAKEMGAIIWSDQISNRSTVARTRIAAHLSTFGLTVNQLVDEDNDAILSFADVITVPSAYAYDGVASRTPPRAQVHRVPYGVNAKRFLPRHARESGVVRIVARANTVPKGGHLLIRAIQNCGAHLRTLVADKKLQLIIVGPLDCELTGLINEADFADGISVKALSVPHADMPELLASADIFVMPSLSESMSLMCIEAMQAGLPLIITSYCGVDCFRHLQMGVEISDSQHSVAEGLCSVFEHNAHWTAWGAAARKAAGELSWEAYESKIADIANCLLSS